jgi:hypothetical protein
MALREKGRAYYQQEKQIGVSEMPLGDKINSNAEGTIEQALLVTVVTPRGTGNRQPGLHKIRRTSYAHPSKIAPSIAPATDGA